jgi:phage gpG-like protein
MSSQSLTWNGPALTAKMRQAQKDGVDATMSECVIHAKANHTWKNRQFTLEPSINIAEFAREDGAGVVGTWGSQDVKYALIHELGGVIVPVRAKALAIPQADGSVRFVKSVTIPPRPYLRPAADAIYPKLAGNIRKAFEGPGLSRFGASQGGVSDA